MDTKSAQDTLPNPISPPLYLAFELSQKQWKLGFTIGVGQRPRLDVAARSNAEARFNALPHQSDLD
jgi:hypothetical protein